MKQTRYQQTFEPICTCENSEGYSLKNNVALNIVEAYEDETLESWLTRLAEANGFGTYANFYNSFIVGFKSSYKRNRIRAPQPQFNEIIKRIQFDNLALFYIKHSFHSLNSMLAKSLFLQKRLLTDSLGICKSRATKKPTRNICPICQKEKPYIRRSHNITDVKVCYIHNCSLIDQKGKKLIDKITENDIKYAKYAHELINNNYDLNLHNLRISSNRFLSQENAIKSLMKVYPDGNLPLPLNFKVPSDKEYKYYFVSNNLCDVEHLKCGTRFFTTLKCFNLGLKCPICTDKAKAYASMLSDNYEFVKIDIDNEKIVFKHLDCGAITTARLETFIEGRRCNCETLYTSARIKKLINDTDEYEFISYENETLLVKHKNCGKILKRKAKHKFTMPVCQDCYGNVDHRESIDRVKEIADKYGYEFICAYKNENGYARVTLKCSKGHVFSKNAFALNQYRDCPQCKKDEYEQSVLNEIDEFIKTLNKDELFLTNRETTNIVNKMKKRGMLYCVSKGIYSLKKLSNKEIIEQLYISRGGEALGYTCGATFLQELGFDCNDSIFNFSSYGIRNPNKDSRTYLKISERYNYKFRRKNPIKGYTSEYWHEAQLADCIMYVVSEYTPLYVKNRLKNEKFIKAITKYIKDNNVDLDVVNNLLKINMRNPVDIKEVINA